VHCGPEGRVVALKVLQLPMLATETEDRLCDSDGGEELASPMGDESVDRTLYEQLGGKAAVEAAVDLFYDKVLADERIHHFFDGVDMARQRGKQKIFLTYVFGGPVKYEGKDMRQAHQHLDLREEHFTAVAENLQSTLEELSVPAELIKQVMEIAASTHDDVLDV